MGCPGYPPPKPPPPDDMDRKAVELGLSIFIPFSTLPLCPAIALDQLDVLREARVDAYLEHVVAFRARVLVLVGPKREVVSCRWDHMVANKRMRFYEKEIRSTDRWIFPKDTSHHDTITNGCTLQNFFENRNLPPPSCEKQQPLKDRHAAPFCDMLCLWIFWLEPICPHIPDKQANASHLLLI